MSATLPLCPPAARAARRGSRRALALACALAVAVAGTAPPVAAQNALPALGDTDSAEFTVGTERKLGDEIMRQVRVDPDYID
ncbi:MAG: M48 family peptidase, partial [Caldimonas sp.]